MIPDNYKNSLLIPQQLPSFIRDNLDYQKFVSFLQAYYEYLEQNGNVAERTKNLLNYKDVDETIDEFQNYFFNEFLQYFPENSLTSKRELVKFSRELYQTKSTPASFKFLFRALFDSDSQVENAKDYVLIASGGKWSRAKYLRLNTNDEKFLKTKYLKLFGETSKSVGTIENAIIVSGRVELFLSDIARNFVSGETIKIVDNLLKDVYIDGELLTAKIVGIIPKVTVNPAFTGSGYKVGDPVIIVGGLNPEKTNPIKANAEVSSVGVASIAEVGILSGGQGYRSYPNTMITVSGAGVGANLKVVGLDPFNPVLIDYIMIPDMIGNYANVYLNAYNYGITANTIANSITPLIYAIGSVDPIVGYPITSLQIVSGGSKYDTTTLIQANSYVRVANTNYEIGNFGILSPIKIQYGGANYSNGDTVLLTGGSGFGAYANVATVDINGKIKTVQFIIDNNNIYTRGGSYYRLGELPTVSVLSSNNKVIYLASANATSSSTNIIYFSNTSNIKIGMYVSGNGIPSANNPGYYSTDTLITKVNLDSIEISNSLSTESPNNSIYKIEGTALLYVDNILGRGAEFRAKSDKIGEVKTITVTSPGEDYVSTPTTSLKVIDILLYNVNESLLPKSGEVVYQGQVNLTTFKATIDSINVVSSEATRTFRMRVYSYSGSLDIYNPIYIDRSAPNAKDVSLFVRNTYNFNGYVNGVKYYGDGTARANAEFSSGIIQGSGQYINSDGFLSDSNLLESEIINDYSYFVIVQQEFVRYKQLLNNILHPTGKQSVNYYNIKNEQALIHTISSEINKEVPLSAVTVPGVYGILTDPTTLQIHDLQKDITNISLLNVLSQNDHIHLESTNGEIFYSEIETIDNQNDIINLRDGNILEYANVANGYVVGNTVVVKYLTGRYDLINDGVYDNVNKLMDIVYPGDLLTISNNTPHTISSVDYANNIIVANSALNYSGSNTTPEMITITRYFRANNISINYNLDYKYLLGYGNTVTGISIDGFELHDEYDNVIYIPIKL